MSPLPIRTVCQALGGRSRSYRALGGRSRSYRALGGRSRSLLSSRSALLIRWMLVARFRLAAPLSSLGVIEASMGQINTDVPRYVARGARFRFGQEVEAT